MNAGPFVTRFPIDGNVLLICKEDPDENFAGQFMESNVHFNFFPVMCGDADGYQPFRNIKGVL